MDTTSCSSKNFSLDEVKDSPYPGLYEPRVYQLSDRQFYKITSKVTTWVAIATGFMSLSLGLASPLVRYLIDTYVHKIVPAPFFPSADTIVFGICFAVAVVLFIIGALVSRGKSKAIKEIDSWFEAAERKRKERAGYY